MAQTVLSSLDDLSTTKAYVLTTMERGTLEAGDAGLIREETENTSSTAQQFAFVPSSEGASTYYLYSVSKKCFLGVSNTWASKFAADGTFTILTDGIVDGYKFRLKASNGKYVNINGAGNLVIDGWSTADDGNSLKFTEVGDLAEDAKNEIAQLLANYSDSELPLISRTITAYSNASSTDAAYTTFKAVYDEFLAGTKTVAELKAAYSEFLTGRTPVFAEDTKAIIGNKLHTKMYMYFKTSSQKWNVTGSYVGSGTAVEDSPVYLWTIKKQEDGTVKLYNDYSGKWISGNPGLNDYEYKMVDDEASAGSYTAIKHGDYVDFVDLSFDNVALAALHMVDWDGVVRWKNDADATASNFSIITDVDSYLAKWTTALSNIVSDECLGNKQLNKEITSALADLNNATAANYVSLYKVAETAISESFTITPEPNAYYTIEVARYNDHVGQVLTEGYGDTNNTDGSNALKHVTVPTNIVPALWQFETTSTDGQYYIKAVNSGSYLSKTNGTGYALRLVDTSSADKGTYSMGKNSVNVAEAVSLKDVNASSNTLISTQTGESGHVVAWDGGNDGSGNNFKIKEVTEIPVAITSAGYATLNLPFAVTIPSDVKAYKGTKGETEITLTEISSVIPAKQPVILVANEGTYSFPIAASNAVAAETSGLSGTLVPVTIAADATAYILKNGSNGVGMYKVTSETERTIPANKAYVAGETEESSSNVLAFNFGDVTGINTIVAADAKANTYYDLNGRQVLYPAHGVFVKGNGQKVYIK